MPPSPDLAPSVATALSPRMRTMLRILLSSYLTNGLSAAFGLLLISSAAHLLFGPLAAAAASVGVIAATPPDLPAPLRGKARQLLPAVLLTPPLFIGVQALHSDPLRLGLLLVPASFVAFLGAAWGKRGLPISVSVMFAMLFSMATPAPVTRAEVMQSGLGFAAGAAVYLVYATAANALLNRRYRVLVLAELLMAVAALTRTLAERFTPPDAPASSGAADPTGRLMRAQAALSDQLQGARNLLLESPRTPQRLRLAGVLQNVLELRDLLLAAELDVEPVRADAGQAAALSALRMRLDAAAGTVDDMADALLLGRLPSAGAASLPARDSTRLEGVAALAAGLSNRIGHVEDEIRSAAAVLRGESEPDLELVRASWRLFVSPTSWSWRPAATLWNWDAPPLRHAIRAALAIATAYAVSVAVPWGTHDYWILLTIVVVLRGSLAQTLERRNSRVAGTLVGCGLAMGLIALRAPLPVMLLALTLAQAVAHAFALQRYVVTAVAATVLALVQAHLLNAGVSTAFEAIERIADTLVGVGLAWAFSYVLPSWERGQVPMLVSRTLATQARHAVLALGLWPRRVVDDEPELAWRLARRDAHDSLSALVQATQRSLSEPRAVRPPVEPLSRMTAHGYRLLAQLTALKALLLLRRSELRLPELAEPLSQTARHIEAVLGGSAPAAPKATPIEITHGLPLTGPEAGLNAWVLRRLALARESAEHLRAEAEAVRTRTQAPRG